MKPIQFAWLVGGVILLVPGIASAQLFTNLQALGSRYPVGDPTLTTSNSIDGPKGICTADFNNDLKPDIAVANIDGTVTLLMGNGAGGLSAPLHLQTGSEELRGIVCGDFTGDHRPDIATVSPYAGRVYLFINGPSGFGSPRILDAWPGARNLGAGDFDGDGMLDLVVAGTTNGIAQWRALGDGEFVTVTNILLDPDLDPNLDFPKPVFSIEAFRRPGETRDSLLVTHAESLQTWLLAPDMDGALTVAGVIETPTLHSLAVGPLTQPADSGQVDFIGASRDEGTLVLYRGTGDGFEPLETYRVPGGPRALAIADLNGDNWNDVVVVIRNFDRVLTYQNSNGVLIASKEMPVGSSPRELVLADFNSDQTLDAAVMNRDSQDVSVLITFPGEAGFAGLDMLYPVEGQVSGLQVFDFDGDGHDDVMQLHRASGEVSLRLAREDGTLGPPRLLPMGSVPSAQTLIDVNNDDLTDIITANLGRGGNGSISVRLGLGGGEFDEENRFALPAGINGGLFALVAGDFNNDGNVDLAAGFFDCRIAFFEGHGDGTFSFTQAHLFVFEARVMVAGDFDQDGDLDIAGAGYAGDVLVVENEGDLLHTPQLLRHEYPATSSGKAGTRDILTADINGDGDLDLIVGTGDGVILFIGLEGIAFERVSDGLAGTRFPTAGVVTGDFDGNGTPDLAVSCQVLSCVSILTLTNNSYELALAVDVPSGAFLATGDLDGDGLADLVGTGEVLWTALSTRPARKTEPLAKPASRTPLPRMVINEVLAINNRWALQADGGRTSDWVELFNGQPSAVSLNGWILRLIRSDNGMTSTSDFAFPPTAFLGNQRHLLVIFSDERRTIYHTGFRLPGGGGTLLLLNQDQEEIDRIEYPAQQENVSFARYHDGAPALVNNPYPSPGEANEDNGPAEPEAKLMDFDLATLAPGAPIRFQATGRDDLGIVSVAMIYQRLDEPDAESHRLQLYDDGMHEDGAVLDGLFAGTLELGLPAGAEIQFYLEVVDLSGKVIYEPDEPVFARSSQALTLHTLAVGLPPLGLEISEVVAWNTNGLRNEIGQLTDWIEVRNCSGQPVALGQLQLAQDFFGNRSRFSFASDDVLQPGEHRVVFSGAGAAPGSKQAPFGLNRAGDHLVLTGSGPSGARTLIDWVSFNAQQPDLALARLGCGGAWFSLFPTPEAANVAGPWLVRVTDDGTSFMLAFPTERGKVYTVEEADSMVEPAWRPTPPIQGDGIEHVISEPLQGQQYYRIREE